MEEGGLVHQESLDGGTGFRGRFTRGRYGGREEEGGIPRFTMPGSPDGGLRLNLTGEKSIDGCRVPRYVSRKGAGLVIANF